MEYEREKKCKSDGIKAREMVAKISPTFSDEWILKEQLTHPFLNSIS